MTPFRGTAIYTKLNQEGRIIQERNWNFYNGYNVAFKPKKINEVQLLHAHRVLWKKAFSPMYSFKRVLRGMFSLRRGAFLLSLFMNSFYAYKRVRKNYPIDMSKRTDLNKLAEPRVKVSYDTLRQTGMTVK
jgi:Domain of unknown function (DUF4070)